jgi:hypothetical protein
LLPRARARDRATDYGIPHPDLIADLVCGALGRAIDRIDAGHAPDEIVPETVAFVHRAVGLTDRNRKPTPKK